MADGHPRAPHRPAQQTSEACPPASADEYLRLLRSARHYLLRRATLTRSLCNSDVSESVALRGRPPPGRPPPDWCRGQEWTPGVVEGRFPSQSDASFSDTPPRPP